ncbi:MAG TPA: hypothetical protein VEF34_21765 [Syntrophobacteraceae bacterium]|nr:hypothetical protein [Syntrophobacteraceae bacterium]
MEISNNDFGATGFSKHPEDYGNGAMATGEGEYGVFLDSSPEQRSHIVCAYLKVLEDIKGPIAVDDLLPYPKEQIGKALLRELAEEPECDLRRRLEIAYVLLESFIPYEDYRVIEDFKHASLCAQEAADMGDPTSILRSAQMMKKANGDSAVRLEEKIYEKMRERQRRLNSF